MSEADKLFDELGYKIREKDEKKIYYEKIEGDVLAKYLRGITFSLDNLQVEVFTQDIGMGGTYDYITTMITMQELKAINAKVHELGWSDE